jgi:GNAT superfamily N-acetyltransferase
MNGVQMIANTLSTLHFQEGEVSILDLNVANQQFLSTKQKEQSLEWAAQKAHNEFKKIDPRYNTFSTTLRVFEERQKNPKERVFVAVLKKPGGIRIPLGTASFVEFDEPRIEALGKGWLADLYVEPIYHCRGIARALIEQAKIQAHAASTDLKLYYDAGRNESFYQKLGFTLGRTISFPNLSDTSEKVAVSYGFLPC